MISIRKANERGYLDYGWLKANYTFSFASYFDPAHMGFRSLRVMNNDLIAPKGGFETHPHKNMEIITIILEGSLEHRDTMGNHSVIHSGEIQVMSAGTGVFHSEFNPIEDKATKLYQIWIKPNVLNVEPRYEQFSFKDKAKKNSIIDLVSPSGVDETAKIHQDVFIRLGSFNSGYSIDLKICKSKGYWIQVLSGEVEVNGNELSIGDGVSLEDAELVSINSLADCEILYMELA